MYVPSGAIYAYSWGYLCIFEGLYWDTGQQADQNDDSDDEEILEL